MYYDLVDFPAMEAKEVRRRHWCISEAVCTDAAFRSSARLDEGRGLSGRERLTHQKILLISVPQEQIKKYQRMFQAAGLRLRALEIESLSVARIFSGDPTLRSSGYRSRSTNIIF